MSDDRQPGGSEACITALNESVRTAVYQTQVPNFGRVIDIVPGERLDVARRLVDESIGTIMLGQMRLSEYVAQLVSVENLSITSLDRRFDVSEFGTVRAKLNSASAIMALAQQEEDLSATGLLEIHLHVPHWRRVLAGWIIGRQL